MSLQPTRRPRWARLLLPLGGFGLLTVLAVAALLLGGAHTERARSQASDTNTSMTAAVGGREHAAPSPHTFHQPPLTRARGLALALLAMATAVAASGSRRIHLARVGRDRSLRVLGLPPGRAPPRLRLA